MSAPFAALEARVNAAVIAHLANATADFGGGVVVDGVFRDPAVDAFGMVASDQPTFEALTESIVAVVTGSAVTINGRSYVVASVSPDSTGMSVLTLK